MPGPLAANEAKMKPLASELLYERVLPARFSCSDREDKVRNITLTISLQTLEKLSQGSNHRLLHMQMTDVLDPFFLHTLDVSETEFHNLKSEQHLLVDFASFPAEFIQYINMCIGQHDQPPNTLKANIKFVHPGLFRFNAVVTTSSDGLSQSSTFSVMEMNQLKRLQHIALNFRKATDETLKRYLAECNEQLKGDLERTRDRLSSTERALEGKNHQLQQLSLEHADVKQRQALSSDAMKQKFQQEMMNERSKQLESMELERKDFDSQKQILVREASEKLDAVSKQLAELQQAHSKQAQEKYELMSQLQEKGNRLTSTQQELQLTKTQLSELRTASSLLDANKFDLEKTLQEHKLRLAKMEQQVLEKDKLLANMGSLQEASEDQKKSLNSSLQLMQAAHATSEGQLQECVREINKGNEIIKQLQTELKTTRHDLKGKEAALSTHEQQLLQMQKKLEQRDERLRLEDKALRDASARAKEADSRGSELTAKLDHANQQLQSKMQVIDWLNKELNASKYEPIANAAKEFGMESMLPPRFDSFSGARRSFNNLQSSFNQSSPPSSAPFPTPKASLFQQSDSLSSLAQPLSQTISPTPLKDTAAISSSVHFPSTASKMPESLSQTTIDTLAKYIGWFDSPTATNTSHTSSLAPPGRVALPSKRPGAQARHQP